MPETSSFFLSYDPIILFVDDNKMNRMIGKRMLEKICPEGTHLHFAEDGLEAVEKVQELKPHLIITDMMMPNLNGDQAVRKIRELGHTMQIIGCSTQPDAFEVFKKAGANGIIPKKYTLDLLRKVVKASLPE